VAPRSASAQRTVNLAVGFNPVVLTFPNDTSIATVASGIAPASALDSIWKYVPAEGRWMGYSPAVPVEVNDLQTVKRLDPVFIFVKEAATITMPQIGG
jgi:hypothetical protein